MYISEIIGGSYNLAKIHNSKDFLNRLDYEVVTANIFGKNFLFKI